MIKVDEKTLEELILQVEHFEYILKDRDTHRDEEYAKEKNSYALSKEINQIKAQISSVEYRTKIDRANELDNRESNLKSLLKLEYDKGYAAAYTEVTNKMRNS